MAAGLRLFCQPDPQHVGNLTYATDMAAIATGHSKSYGKTIQRNLQAYMEAGVTPKNHYGNSNPSVFQDEDLCSEVKTHLRSIGKYAKAEDAVTYLANPEVKQRYNLQKVPGKRTIQRWMKKKLGYRWGKHWKGQYVDGHKREDVVWYWNHRFIPEWTDLERRMETYDPVTGEIVPPNLQPGERPVKVFTHDECIFYGNDQRDTGWIPDDASPEPAPKGEGLSFMYAGFISINGWLRSDDPNKNPEVIIRPGASRDGYMTNERVCEQLRRAIKLARELWPDYDLVFLYDNATTHTKQRDNAPSAIRMTLGPSAKFAVSVSDGPKKTKKIPMGDARFADGSPQSLYYPMDHPHNAGEFKGILQILLERGIDARHLNLECPKFKCAPGAQDCCARRLLFNQPDFANQKSVLEDIAEAQNCRILFLPKFHCELNPIKQCWGFAKRVYWEMPRAKREPEIKSNMMKSLDSVPLQTIRRFWNRSLRYIDAYRHGLNGQWAIWATKKYQGHRVLPAGIMQEIEEEFHRMQNTPLGLS